MIKEFVVGNMNNNCYLITKEDKAVLIDSGDCYEQVMDFAQKNKLKLVAIILTHGHFDHASNAKKFQDDGVKIYIHKNDADKLYTENNLAAQSGYTFENLKADVLFEEGKLVVSGFEFEIIHTPGHSKGSVSIIYQNHIFVGDTIFENGYGRVDLYDGDFSEMKQSIRTLREYKNNNYIFHYGHS